MTKEEAIKYLQQLYPNGGHCWLDEQRIEAIGMAVKALQEEPVSIDFEKELYKAFGQVKDFTLGMRIAKRFYDIGKNSQEPVSEDLGEYINELSKQFPEVSFAKLSRIAVRVSRWQQNQDVKNKLPKVTDRTELDEYAYQCAYDMSNDWMIENPTWDDVEVACKLGAKWQKQQDQSTIELAEDHAMLAGMEKMREQMMEKAVDGEVGYWNQRGLSVLMELPRELEEDDKCKVIIIKED